MSVHQPVIAESGVPRLCLSVFEAAKSIGLSENTFAMKFCPASHICVWDVEL
jgi:hypothetical protein